jgi:hypothetical protein
MGESIFVKFLIDFPPPPIFHHFEFLPESIPDPPRCDFFYGPHEQLTCGLFLKAKNEYHTNPSLFMMSLQEDNHASHSAIFIEDCKDYCPDMPTNPTSDNALFDAFPFNDDLFEIYPTQDQLVSNKVLFMDESNREDSLDLNSTIPHISHDYSEEDERGDSSGHIGSYVGSSSENSHKNNQYFTSQNSFTNPLFQFKEVEEFNDDIHISLACMISFDDDKFKGIPMHLNPLFSPSVHGSSFPDQEIVNDDLIMLKEPINSILFIKTSNHHSNVIDHAHVSNIKQKSRLVGWQVLQDGNHFFWILMGPLPLLHAFVGWQGDRHSLCIIFQFINHPSKIDDTFLYEKCHPT